MNRFGETRAALADALGHVLPDRVFPYEPSSPVPLGIWLGVALPNTRTTNIGSTVKTVLLPVVISFDGSDIAQIAGLDELVSKVEDAIEAMQNARLVSARFIDSPDDRSRSTVVLDVDVVTGVRTLCAPTVREAAVPPPVVQLAS